MFGAKLDHPGNHKGGIGFPRERSLKVFSLLLASNKLSCSLPAVEEPDISLFTSSQLETQRALCILDRTPLSFCILQSVSAVL